MKATLFDRVGGFARVRLIVSAFYDKILESERLYPYFENINLRRLIDHQTKFISALMGGPASFSDEQLARAHGHLRISEEEYDEMAALFTETLEDFGIRPADVERLSAHIASLRQHVTAGAPAEAS